MLIMHWRVAIGAGCAHLPVFEMFELPDGADPGQLFDETASASWSGRWDPNGGVALPAAVVVEMVQGEGGVVPADGEFVRRLRLLTRELGVPLVVDEVQTGCGRTGSWFALDQYGIEPDVTAASKALSGIGQPVAILLDSRPLIVSGRSSLSVVAMTRRVPCPPAR
jgi:4-aminobutyrate aminotransferase-like enzyme